MFAQYFAPCLFILLLTEIYKCKIKKQQNEIMKRIFAFFILCIMLLADLNAHGIVVDARIVDAETREALPNASVCIDGDKSFIANADGE